MTLKKIRNFLLLTGSLYLFSFGSAYAYTLSVPFNQITEISSPAEYIRAIYTFGIGLGSVLALAMIVFGGIEYTVSEAISSKEDAKNRIESAIWGLVLLLTAFIILNFINPGLSIENIKDPTLENLRSETIGPVNNQNGSCGNNILDPGEECDVSANILCSELQICTSSCECRNSGEGF